MFYNRLADRLKPYETKTRHPDDQPIDPGDAEIVIFGMGRVGTGAYDFLREHHGDVIVGCDSDPVTVRRHQEAGRNVFLGDPTDLDFWERQVSDGDIEEKETIRMALLAMPKFTANMEAVELIKPKIAIPMHYDTFDVIRVNPEDFAIEARAFGIESFKLEYGGIFEF